MKEIKYNKCMTTHEMVKIVSKLSSIDTALDILIKAKETPHIKLRFDKNNLLFLDES